MNTHVKLQQRLRFRQILPADFGEISRKMELTDSRTCDYTLGGIVLWTNYFGYRMAEDADTLYISGRREDNLDVKAYAMPLGGAEFSLEVEQLLDQEEGNLWFSAIPEDRLHLFANLDCDVEVTDLGAQWSDYLYDIQAMSSLAGNAMKKKRNHVHRFFADNPTARLEAISPRNIGGCLDLMRLCGHDDSPTGRAEYAALEQMLTRWADFAPWFTSRALMVGDQVVGFTVGETKGDTLHVHIERANHAIQGANETLASQFAAEMLALYPRLLYVNRQDDAGDPGLRASKESWHPLRLLPKFNIHLTA